MAVYTHLDEMALRALWSVYDDDKQLLAYKGIEHGSINTTYRLETEAGVHYLRINEKKTTDDVWYERDLLDALQASSLGGVVTPTIRKTRIGGSFFLVEKGKWAAIFPELPGRDLGVFEVDASHTAQIGAFLARAHGALRQFNGGRANPYGLAVVERWLERLVHVESVAAVARRLVDVTRTVRERRTLLPHGVIHGDLFVDNTKWHRGKLAAVFDWEMAGRDHLALDIAICIQAWCWVREKGAFDVDRCRALLTGYQEVRALSPSERRGLFTESLLAAVRFTASRVRDFEVPRAEHQSAARAYLDYRDFLARLDALMTLGDKSFRRLVGIA